MGIGDLGCDTPDGDHVWELVAPNHQRCLVCRCEVIKTPEAAARREANRLAQIEAAERTELARRRLYGDAVRTRAAD